MALGRLPRFCGAKGRCVDRSSACTNSAVPSGRPVCVDRRIAASSDALSLAFRNARQLSTVQRACHISRASHHESGTRAQWTAALDHCGCWFHSPTARVRVLSDHSQLTKNRDVMDSDWRSSNLTSLVSATATLTRLAQMALCRESLPYPHLHQGESRGPSGGARGMCQFQITGTSEARFQIMWRFSTKLHVPGSRSKVSAT